MSKWEEKTYKLDQLGTVSRGKSRHRPRNDQSLYGGKYPFIQTGDVKSANFYITKYSQTYNEKGLSQSKLWRKGTLCITIAANIAETAILGIDACFPDSIVGFIPFENISDVRYIKYCFDTYQKEMQAMSLGATQDNFSVEKMLKVKFIIPPLHTQRKIADILSTYDDLIENNNRRIELLEKSAENLYKEWFVRFRFPGYKETKFENGLPQGWKVELLGEISNAIFSGGTPNTKIVEYWNGEYYWLSSGETRNRRIYKTDKTITKLGVENSSTKLAKLNDLVMACAGQGKTRGQLSLIMNEMYVNQSVIVIRLEDELFIPYVFENLRSRYDELRSLSDASSTRGSITTDLLKKTKILIPNQELIKQYAEIVSLFMKKLRVLEIKNDNLIKQRDLILPRLMSGKIEVL